MEEIENLAFVMHKLKLPQQSETTSRIWNSMKNSILLRVEDEAILVQLLKILSKNGIKRFELSDLELDKEDIR